jgi:hypothetical protein
MERHYEKLFREFANENNEKIALVDLNVLCFGAVLYEMATGMEMQSIEDIEKYPSVCSPIMKQVTYSVLISFLCQCRCVHYKRIQLLLFVV